MSNGSGLTVTIEDVEYVVLTASYWMNYEGTPNCQFLAVMEKSLIAKAGKDYAEIQPKFFLKLADK